MLWYDLRKEIENFGQRSKISDNGQISTGRRSTTRAAIRNLIQRIAKSLPSIGFYILARLSKASKTYVTT